MITVTKEAIGVNKDDIAIKKIAIDINMDELAKLDKKAVSDAFGAAFLLAIKKFEEANAKFFEEFVDSEGRLCWKDCDNVRGQPYTQKQLTEKLMAKAAK